MKPEWVRITLYDESKGVGTGQPMMPENAQQLIVWLQGHLAKVPEEYRDRVELNFINDCGDITATLEYYRPQTPEEMEAAEKKKAADTAIQERLDRATFQELKRRFEP